ncbi:MAG: hypothetical protein ACYSUC_03870 [Planctomycetota bacterium]
MKARILKRFWIGVLLLAATLVAGCSIDSCYSAYKVEVGHARHHRPYHIVRRHHRPYHPGHPHPGYPRPGRWQKVYVH